MSLKPLAGKTLFITGASRGIGLAIGLRAARDGANVAIAAKTAEPHPKLEGTIYTAAEAIERAGGRALPIILDVRDAEAIEAAVEQAAKHFGGIDICVNNASALKPWSTRDITPRDFDLMHQVNTRASFLTSRACLPFLVCSDNPHILMIAPPVSAIEPQWFGPHLAYSIAKFGMSLCVLGLAEELRDAGVAVNALWPRTIIGTAAIRFARGEEEGRKRMRHARTPQIMADAAHAVLSAPSRARTGAFLIDDALLLEQGVSDFAGYQVDPDMPLQIDMFVPADAPPPPLGTRLIGRDAL